jgi:hypothetical protein
MTRLRARIAVLLPALALTATAVAAAAAPAPALAASGTSSPPTQNLGQAAAGWLARQMVGGSHFTDTFNGTTFPDQGLTIDSVFAFAATGTADNYGARAIAWLARPHILTNYIGNGSTSSFAGATAKLLLATEVRGVDPATFGDVNLPARLAGLLTASGRYSDVSRFGDFSNAFSQSLAIIALARLRGAPASAVSFLAGTECADGGFPLEFGQATCTSDPDATAMDAQALLAAGRFGPADQGLTWLASVQQPDGGFISTPGAAPNTNSTGLAGEAFAAAGWVQPAALARQFLASVQVGCSGRFGQRGALAFDTTGFKQSTAIRATGQGTLGLADIGLAWLSASGTQAGDPRLECSS